MERKEGTIMSISDLRNYVIKMEQDLDQTLLSHANDLMRNGFELTYKCLNVDWEKAAMKLLEHQGFIVASDIPLCLKISVPTEKQLK